MISKFSARIKEYYDINDDLLICRKYCSNLLLVERGSIN